MDSNESKYEFSSHSMELCTSYKIMKFGLKSTTALFYILILVL